MGIGIHHADTSHVLDFESLLNQRNGCAVILGAIPCHFVFVRYVGEDERLIRSFYILVSEQLGQIMGVIARCLHC